MLGVYSCYLISIYKSHKTRKRLYEYNLFQSFLLTLYGCNSNSVSKNGIDYICITDIAKQKNSAEPKDVVKNWMRVKNTLEYLGLWESLNNPDFNGVEFDPIMREAGSNSFTMSPSRWIELTNAIAIHQMSVLESGDNGTKLLK